MNLFVTDLDPIVAASHLDDLRLRKMILESTQMLAMAMDIRGCNTTMLPKTKANTTYKIKGPHRNHPVTQWTARDMNTFVWHYNYLAALNTEYAYRFDKTHACYSCLNSFKKFIDWKTNGRIGALGVLYPYEFQNSSAFKEIPVLEAYRLTMIKKWNEDKRYPKWTSASMPAWALGKVDGAVIVENGNTIFKSKQLEAAIEDQILNPQS